LGNNENVEKGNLTYLIEPIVVKDLTNWYDELGRSLKLKKAVSRGRHLLNVLDTTNYLIQKIDNLVKGDISVRNLNPRLADVRPLGNEILGRF
jgi:hypothetical protein